MKENIAAHFGLKVAKYGHNADVQQQLLEKLLPLILEYGVEPGLWADFGCGDGALERMMFRSGIRNPVVGLDLSEQSVAHCLKTVAKGFWICADLNDPPLRDGSLDGIITASVLQWCGDLSRSVNSIARLLKPEGILAFSIFTEGSFNELFSIRKKFRLPLPFELAKPVDIQKIQAMCDLHCEQVIHFSRTLFFPTAYRLLQHLSSTGSTSVPSHRLNRSELHRFCALYEESFGTDHGIPLTYRAMVGVSRKGPTYG